MDQYNNKTENKIELLGQISEYLSYDSRTRPDFLISDCQDFVSTLHAYRLSHLIENIEDFIEYLDVLEQEHITLLADAMLSPQAQATIQALFLLSCVEFTSASKDRMLIREMETVKK